MEITELCFHGFFAKIPSNWRFTKELYHRLIWRKKKRISWWWQLILIWCCKYSVAKFILSKSSKQLFSHFFDQLLFPRNFCQKKCRSSFPNFRENTLTIFLASRLVWISRIFCWRNRNRMCLKIDFTNIFHWFLKNCPKLFFFR